MGKFLQILTELSARDTPVFSFPDDNLSKYEGIWFGIANGQILSMFDSVICPRRDNGGVLYFNVFIYLRFN